MIISQLWCEHKRRILIIAPTILRKQWAQELADKFHIDSIIVDSREYKAKAKRGESAILQDNKVVICSYHFAWGKNREIAGAPWDLVVVDEAHRLRNVYKPGNRIATSIRKSISNRPLLLLTATPLQNSLLELYGLVSFIDEHLFGDINAFKARYMHGPIENRQLNELRLRLKPICQRTLRRQVTEYVRFTNRIPITQDFTPTNEEQLLYDQVSSYLSKDELHALPISQRRLVTLVLRKLLASSTFAIAATLESLKSRLEGKHQDVLKSASEDFEVLEEIFEEWADPDTATNNELESRESSEKQEILAEIKELTEFGDLAKSITTNAKGQALLVALRQGFEKLKELGANRKAVIFTESRRTQEYLFSLLSNNGYDGNVLTINGVNSDDRSREIYKAWVERHKGEPVVTGSKVIDIRTALVEHFRDHSDILIATEAAAEGINLQFCSLVINYDLPWNPQRIEQRIGRCHRYKQEYDVVVINFLNRSNAADRRVFELLDEKFRLFQGVFGSSDEVLGALESGMDFERRIADIYQRCRTEDEINDAFDQLRLELDEEIQARMADTRTKLLENFDEDVRNRLRISSEESTAFLGKVERYFWELTKSELSPYAEFNDSTLQFHIKSAPDGLPDFQTGSYQFLVPGHSADGLRPYRYGGQLSEAIIDRAKQRTLPPVHIVFDYTNWPEHAGLIRELVGKSGWLQVSKLTVTALEDEDVMILAGIDDNGNSILPDACEKLFSVPGKLAGEVVISDEVCASLAGISTVLQESVISRIAERNNKFFDDEIEKLDRWAEDLKHGLETELKDLDLQIKQVSRDAKITAALEDKIALHKEKKNLESQRNRKRRELFAAQDKIDESKEQLIAEVEARLKQEVLAVPLFVVRWSIT